MGNDFGGVGTSYGAGVAYETARPAGTPAPVVSWETDQHLTDALNAYVAENGMDLFGIADVNAINAHARPGRRPCDMYPSAKALMVIGFGLMDPYTRGWVRSGNSGKFYSLALIELERRCWLIKRFLRQNGGYHCFGGEAYGGGLFSCGVRFGEIAASCGLGYIGNANTLVTPKYGPRINMVCMATDAPLVPVYVEPERECGTCTACQKACPSGAILGDGYFHGRQCETYINAQPNKRFYNSHVDQDCDVCLGVCPKGEYRWKGFKVKDALAGRAVAKEAAERSAQNAGSVEEDAGTAEKTVCADTQTAAGKGVSA